MDKKEFKEIVGSVFKKNGFKYGKKHFYLEDDHLLVYIDFQKSNFSNSYYIEYCFMIKNLHPKIERFQLKDVDFRSRFTYFNEKNEAMGSFELEYLSSAQVELSVQKIIDTEIQQAFEVGIVTYLNARPIMKLKSTRATKDFLSRFE